MYCFGFFPVGLYEFTQEFTGDWQGMCDRKGCDYLKVGIFSAHWDFSEIIINTKK